MLEDGSYAVTDYQGRYHFEGVDPGLHVVQVDQAAGHVERLGPVNGQVVLGVGQHPRRVGPGPDGGAEHVADIINV